VGSTGTRTTATYREGFSLTSFRAEENYGSEAGLFYNTDNSDETEQAYFVLRYEFLGTQEPLNGMVGAGGKFAENDVHVSHKITSYAHQDAALIGTSEDTEDALKSFDDGQEVPIAYAFEDTAATLGLDAFAGAGPLVSGASFSINVRDEDQVTTRAIRMPWFDTDTDEPMEADQIADMIYGWGWEDDETAGAIHLFVMWHVGEAKLSRIDMDYLGQGFVRPEKPAVLRYLKTSAAGLKTMTMTPILLSGGGFFYTTWKASGWTTKGIGSTIRAAVTYMSIVQGAEVAPGGVARVEKVIGHTLAKNQFGLFSKCARWAKGLRVAGLLVGASIAAYMFFKLADQIGWTLGGVVAAGLYAGTYLGYLVALEVLGSFGAVGVAIAALLILADLITWAITGSGWTDKLLEYMFGDLFETSIDLRTDIDLQVRDMSLKIEDAEDNGLTAGDTIRYRTRVREVIEKTAYGDRSDLSDDPALGNYATPYAHFLVPSGYDVTVGVDADRPGYTYYPDYASRERMQQDHTLQAWVIPNEAAINIPLNVSFKSTYLIGYNKTTSQGTQRLQKTDTDTHNLGQLYYDVFPATVDAFEEWSDLISLDPDRDGLMTHESGQYEIDADGELIQTDASLSDTDGDGLPDGFEVDVEFDPLQANADGDGLTDPQEWELGTDPGLADTDEDGLDDKSEDDGWTIAVQFRGQTIYLSRRADPLSPDIDGDGLEDDEEASLGTNPRSADSDGDGFHDGLEVQQGTDPLGSNLTAEAGGPYSVDEGGTVQLHGSAAASTVGTITYRWDLDDDGVYETEGQNPVYDAAGTNGPDSKTVTFQAEDGVTQDTDRATIEIRNVAPTVNAGEDAEIDEGQTFIQDISFTDPGVDTWTATVDYGDGLAAETLDLGTSKSFELNHDYAPEDATYVVTVTVEDDDGGEGSDTVQVTINNVAPSVDAGADTSANEGASWISSGSFTDPGADTWTATVDYGDGSGAQPLALAENKTFALEHTYADNGVYTVTVCVQDDDGGQGCDNAVATVLNVASVVSAVPAEQMVQYSDAINEISFTATDVAGDTLTAALSWSVDGEFQTSPAFAGLALDEGSCATSEGGAPCVWKVTGNVGMPAGSYTLRLTVQDDDGGSTNADVALTVEPEEAIVVFAEGNSPAERVAMPGGDSGEFALGACVYERDVPLPGEIALAQVSMSLVPMGPGGPVAGTEGETVVADDQQCVTFSFDRVPVNTYTVQVTVGGGYYAGEGEDVLVVYDPSLGFTTGGGWFYWPDTADVATGYPGDKTNLGYTMKYNKKGEKVQGSLLLIRHMADGTIYRVKSNALYGLALGEGTGEPMGWASFGGKCTYKEPNWPESIGNYEFLLYVEDRDEPGTGPDRFWIEVIDGLALERAAEDHTEPLAGGNIVVPHN
jgi:hypothetical protein